MSAIEAPASGATVPTEPESAEPFSFTGRGGEYFGIWIVNVALSVVTIGIYSAWAKVRRMQYFYRNTHVAGSSFDYHGDPVAILKGRIIALVLFAAYSLAGQLKPIAGVAVLIALAAVMPWLLLRSLKFRLHNSSLRGLRFAFHAGNRDAYDIFLKWPALVGISFYLLAPMYHQRLKAFQHNASAFANARFSFDARVAQFYAIYVMLAGIALVAPVVVFLSIGGLDVMMNADPRAAPRVAPALVILFGASAVLVLLLIRATFTAKIANLVWAHTRLGPHRFECRLSAARLFWIYATNLAAIIATLGLFKPFADVRVAKYRVEAMTLVAAGDLDEFFAGQAQSVPATGEEVAEMFDIDIAL